MSSNDQDERLAAELKVMQALAEQSSIFEFEPDGDPPTEYKVTLRGKGIRQRPSHGGDVEYADVHKFRIRLGYSYPQRPPDVRCQTPIFHPNISSIGYIRLDECGLQWEEDMSLDVVCERLWDLVRGAYVDVDTSTDFSTKKWFTEQSEVSLPVDQRPIRDRGGPSPGNVISYRRGPAAAKQTSDDVLFISDDTPIPEMPRKRRDDDDILFIGDE